MKKLDTTYAKNIIKRTPIIYMDTASLMEPQIDDFIDTYEEVFIELHRQITISQAVCYELARHISSNNADKSSKALHVMDLFLKHPNLFIIENKDLTEDDIFKAFADNELIQNFNTNRQCSEQLCITNDRRLGADIYGLNKLKSVKGERIFVCYINKDGELFPSECVTKDLADDNCEAEKRNDTVQQKQDNQSQAIPKTEKVQHKVENPAQKKDSYNEAIYALLGIAIGFCAGKWGKVAIKTLGALII